MKGAIFDLDGTLISSLNLHTKAWIMLFKKYNISLSKKELKEKTGLKNVFFIKKVLKRRKIDNLDPQKLSDEKDKLIVKLLKTAIVKPFSQVENLLMLLKREKIKLGLATSASKKTALLLCGKLIKYFDAKIFAEDVLNGKPDPEVFIKASKRLSLKNKECVVFEDAQSGVIAAKSGGFFCVAKDNNLDQDLTLADLIIKDYNPSKLIKLFKK